MSCLTCGGDLPRGAIGLCERCGLPRIGREPSPAEKRLQMYRANHRALETRAKAEYATEQGAKPQSPAAERAWLALSPVERQQRRRATLLRAMEEAGATEAPATGRPERVR